MLKAIIFDFDGVIVNSEPVHCDCMRRVLAEALGLEITEQDYYDRYVAFSDAEAFAEALKDFRRPGEPTVVADLVARKSKLVRQTFLNDVQPLPGAVELMRQARQAGLIVGVCSSAARDEIELAGRAVGAVQYVQFIVAAEDVHAGKPNPAGYALAVKRAGELAAHPLQPRQCLAVEDSAGGIQAARAAGLLVLAVANTLPAGQLTRADAVVPSLEGVTVEKLAALVEG